MRDGSLTLNSACLLDSCLNFCFSCMQHPWLHPKVAIGWPQLLTVNNRLSIYMYIISLIISQQQHLLFEHNTQAIPLLAILLILLSHTLPQGVRYNGKILFFYCYLVANYINSLQYSVFVVVVASWMHLR